MEQLVDQFFDHIKVMFWGWFTDKKRDFIFDIYSWWVLFRWLIWLTGFVRCCFLV
jgi:hypothetical protein